MARCWPALPKAVAVRSFLVLRWDGLTNLIYYCLFGKNLFQSYDGVILSLFSVRIVMAHLAAFSFDVPSICESIARSC